LIEDDEAVRAATRLLLRVAGYRVTAVASVAEALAAAARDPDIALVVTDYHLGSETGLQAIAALRAAVRADLRAVLVTGDTSSAIRELECDAATRVTSKPIHADELLALIEALRAPPGR
ncbi:MAG: response regulator, partial [Proteobacteria bacterium]|nr:response regulator [Pseudomonadota bacterium]